MQGLHGCRGCSRAAGAAGAAGLQGCKGCRAAPSLRGARGRVAQAAQAFGEALNNGSAGGVIAEMGLNPTGLGVDPFLRALQACPGLPPLRPSVPVLPPPLRALQAATPAAADAMATEGAKPDAEKKDDSMDESKGP